MNCPICGAALETEALFCGACGVRLAPPPLGPGQADGMPTGVALSRDVAPPPAPLYSDLAARLNREDTDALREPHQRHAPASPPPPLAPPPLSPTGGSGGTRRWPAVVAGITVVAVVVAGALMLGTRSQALTPSTSVAPASSEASAAVPSESPATTPSALDQIAAGHGFLTFSCLLHDNSQGQLSLLAYSNLQQIAQIAFPLVWTNPTLGGISSVIACNEGISSFGTSFARSFDLQKGLVAAGSGTQPDGSTHAGWVDLATGKFTDVTALDPGPSGFGAEPVTDTPLGFTAHGTFWFTRAVSGQSTELLSDDAGAAPKLVDQCAETETQGPCWWLLDTDEPVGVSGTSLSPADFENDGIGGVLVTTTDGTAVAALPPSGCVGPSGATVVLFPAGALPTGGQRPSGWTCLGITEKCQGLASAGGSEMVCQDGTASGVFQVSPSASQITVQPLLPANDDQDSLFWPDPSTGLVLFLATPPGGTTTTLYSCNVNHLGAAPVSLASLSAAAATQLETMTFLGAQ